MIIPNLLDFFGDGTYKTCIIAEVSQTHEGSLGQAHAFIDAVAKSGANVIKFQTHIADAESTPAEPFRVKFSYEDETRYDYWKRMEFTEEQWKGLFEHACDKGLIFLSSPFSVEAVDLLERIGVAGWKLGSGEIYNKMVVDRILRTGKPVLFSSGMASMEEIDGLVEQFEQAGVLYSLFQCTTAYPCPPEKVGINMINLFKERYKCPIGLSDHSGTIYPSLAAVALGAKFVEVHTTLSREMFGPDVSSSVTTGELGQMVEGIRFIEQMMYCPVQKDEMAEKLMPLRSIFSKSIVAARHISAGTILEQSMLAVKKPGGGLPPERLQDVVGKQLLVDVEMNDRISEKHFKEQ